MDSRVVPAAQDNEEPVEGGWRDWVGVEWRVGVVERKNGASSERMKQRGVDFTV